MRILVCRVVAAWLLSAACVWGQAQAPQWQQEVRQYAEKQDWAAAMGVVEREMARNPQDAEVLAWRARVLGWSGRLAEAEAEYLKLLSVSGNDPDLWLGLANVYSREGKTEQAVRALETAVKLDPKRADLQLAHGRALRAVGEPGKAAAAFQQALVLAQANSEVRAAVSAFQIERKHELRFGEENDLFNFAGPNHAESVSMASRWNENWSTGVSAQGYQRGGIEAQKFAGSVAARAAKLGAVTVGGAAGHHNGVIPKGEAFFEVDRGAGVHRGVLRGVELAYGQHWYWYDAARILTLNGTVIVYLPRNWTLSAGGSGVRSAFSGTGVEWRPSGVARVGFPLAEWAKKRLSGNVFFAAGTEDFARVDQIGAFASQTYGGALRLQLSARQDVTGYASYQKRTQNRSDLNFGCSYGIHF